MNSNFAERRANGRPVGSVKRYKFEQDAALMQRIYDMADNGATFKDISTATNIPYHTLRYWCRSRETNIKDMHTNRVHQHNEFYTDLHKLYESDPDVTISLLASRYKVNAQNIRAAWKRLGLELDKQRSYRTAAAAREKTVRQRLATDVLRAAWRDYDSGRTSFNGTVASLHTSPGTLKSRWRELGYPVEETIARVSGQKRGRKANK